MERIKEEERKRFHKILDESIDKLNSEKNSKKIHWSKLENEEIQKMINVENAELELACLKYPCSKIIENENFDLINLNLFMIDNLRGNK